jgi:hypothetical protein
MSLIFVDYTRIWSPADMDADPVACSHELVRRKAQEEEARLEPAWAQSLASVMVPAMELARTEDPPPVMILYLYPLVDEPIITSVKIRAYRLDEDVIFEDITFEDIATDLRMPAEMLEQPALEEMVDTRSGPALHVVQRYREPVDPHVEDILESEAFIWILHDDDGPLLVSLSTSYLDLVAAADWRPELLRLASTLTLEPDPDEETG